MMFAAYGSCGRLQVGPTADLTDPHVRLLAAAIAGHMRDCAGCVVRVTVWHRGRVLAEKNLGPEWLADHAGASRNG